MVERRAAVCGRANAGLRGGEMSGQACEWAVRQRLRGTEEQLALLLFAIEAGNGDFVAHSSLRDLACCARGFGFDLPAVLRRLLDARVVGWDAADGGYRLPLQRDFDLRGPAPEREALLAR